jgi:hypothetical protein
MVPATNQPDGTGTILMVLLIIRAGADHSPDGGSGPDGADSPDHPGRCWLLS